MPTTQRSKTTSHAGSAPQARSPIPVRNVCQNRKALAQALGGAALQPKMRVSSPGDATEREADRVADAVMREPSGRVPASFPAVTAAPGAQRMCSDCQEEQGQVQRKVANEGPQEEEGQVQRKAANDTQQQEEEGQVQRKADPSQPDLNDIGEEETLAAKRNSPQSGFELSAKQAAQIGALRGGGSPLPDVDRSFAEERFGRDFAHVRVHYNDPSARDIGARAYTSGNNVVFAPGEYQPGTKTGRKLLAHELAHVVQQGQADAQQVQRKAEQPTPQKPQTVKGNSQEEDVAPDVVEIKDQQGLKISDKNLAWFNGSDAGQPDAKPKPRTKGWLRLKFGDLAAGSVAMTYRKGNLKLAKPQGLGLNHPMLTPLTQQVPDITPQLILTEADTSAVTGHVGLLIGSKIPRKKDFPKILQPHIGKLIPTGFNTGKIGSKIVNQLEAGKLTLGLNDLELEYGSMFKGSMSLASVNGLLTFQGHLTASVKGLKEGSLELNRDANGIYSGEVNLAVAFSAPISGSVRVFFEEDKAGGEGTVGYEGEKFSGQVKLNVMPVEKADQLQAEKAPPQEGETAPAPQKGAVNTKVGDFVVFGEGELDFAFTEWLTGRAQVIISKEGHLTVIGEIRPEAQITLFDEKPWDKTFTKIEARARYGLPVVGNLNIGAGIEPGAFANFGPGLLKDIAVLGTYSTKPDEADNFSIQGTLHIDASAGGKLRATVFAGTEILDHDLKAGGALTGLLGIQGYLDATPVIGYREKTSLEGQDKKGEFFIKGDAEIAAQAFLGLQGELFIEVDAPYWSPVPDKQWTWPLGGKTWPLGDSIGVGAEMEYVFGSGKAPDFKAKPAQFDADKFANDLFQNRTSSKKDAKAHAKWREKMPKDQARGTDKGDVPKAKEGEAKVEVEGKGGKGSGAPPAAQKNRADAPDKAKTAEGKTVAQLKAEAAKKDPKKDPNIKGAKDKPNPNVSKAEKEAEANKFRAASEVDKVLKTGIRRGDLVALLAHLQKTYKLKAARIQKDDDVELVNSLPLERPAKAWCEDEKGNVQGTANSRPLNRRESKGGPNKKVGVIETKSDKPKTVMGALEENIKGNGFGEKAYKWMPPTAERPKLAAATIDFNPDFASHFRKGEMTARVGTFGNVEHAAREKNLNMLRAKKGNGYEGGHLVGYQFGGTEDYDNLVPQLGNTINRGLYARIENFVSENLGDKPKAGSQIYYEIRLDYGKNYGVPLNFLANALFKQIGRETTFKKSRKRTPLANLNLGGSPLDDKVETIKKLRKNPKTKVNFCAVLRPGKAGMLQVTDYSPMMPLPEDPTKQQPDKTKVLRILHLVEGAPGIWKVCDLKPEITESYNAMKGAKQETKEGQDSAEASITEISIPTRLPDQTHVRVVLDGIANPKIKDTTANDSENQAGSISQKNCIIVAEGQTPKKEAVTKDNVADKLTENAGKPVKVVSVFTITHKNP